MQAKTFKDYSREVSNGREDRNAEIFDGSFGRKKREDNSHERHRINKFKTETQPLFKDSSQGGFDTGNAKTIYGGHEAHFERKFGINGPSGRTNKTSRLSQREF